MNSSGPLTAFRPPSEGTRRAFGWPSVAGATTAAPGIVPLVQGEASMWDRHLRRNYLSSQDINNQPVIPSTVPSQPEAGMRATEARAVQESCAALVALVK